MSHHAEYLLLESEQFVAGCRRFFEFQVSCALKHRFLEALDFPGHCLLVHGFVFCQLLRGFLFCLGRSCIINPVYDVLDLFGHATRCNAVRQIKTDLLLPSPKKKGATSPTSAAATKAQRRVRASSPKLACFQRANGATPIRNSAGIIKGAKTESK